MIGPGQTGFDLKLEEEQTISASPGYETRWRDACPLNQVAIVGYGQDFRPGDDVQSASYVGLSLAGQAGPGAHILSVAGAVVVDPLGSWISGRSRLLACQKNRLAIAGQARALSRKSAYRKGPQPVKRIAARWPSTCRKRETTDRCALSPYAPAELPAGANRHQLKASYDLAGPMEAISVRPLLFRLLDRSKSRLTGPTALTRFWSGPEIIVTIGNLTTLL
jgi:hypothetical protein